MLVYDLALADVIYDMHDKLKSATRGYGTMDYELIGYFPGDLVRMDILVKNDRVDAFSIICDRRDADIRGRAIIKKLKKEIDRHMFEIAAAGRDRHPRHRPRDDLRDAEERHRQVLRRRHHAQAQALGQAEGRQEADEVDRPGRHPAKGVPGGAGDGRRKEVNVECRIQNDE